MNPHDKHNEQQGPVSPRKLRIFAGGLARLCADIGIISYDVECIFTPRTRTEYASVEARSRAGNRTTRGDDVILIVTGSPDGDDRKAT